MNWTFCNATGEYEEIVETPLWKGYTFHHFGLLLCAIFGLIAVILSVYLMFMHATHYLKPHEQKHIIRILFMVPIYAVVSFVSYLYYKHSIYFDVLRDCYEAFAIASFFALLCHYIAPDLHSQKEYFRTLKPVGWVWPMSWARRCCGGERGWARTPRSGLTWFNIVWFCVFQYCLVRVMMSVVALVTQALGRYCLDSLSPAFAHIWVTVIEAICVTFAMFCLIQFYIQLRHDLAEHRPFLKVLAIKLVIFLSFWQTIIINFLTSTHVIKESERLAIPDVKIGIPALLLCIEMALFSILHIWAYPWKPYDIKSSKQVLAEGGPEYQSGYQGGPMGIKAFADAFNPWDFVKAVGRGFRWIAVGRSRRLQDESYKAYLQGTALESTSGNGKTGKYHPLHDSDSQVNLPYHDPSRNGFSRPVASAPGGDIGAVGVAGMDPERDFRTVHPMPNPYHRQDGDTGYHGAHGALDSGHGQENGVTYNEARNENARQGPWSNNPRTPWPVDRDEAPRYGNAR